MREVTTLPHEAIDVGRLWNPQIKSGNFDTNRLPIDTIVLHTMVGTLPGSTAWFRNPVKNGAAHYGIGLDGKIVCWLQENVNAYHSGKYSVNQRSIGIEHEDMGKPNDPRSDALYESSAQLVADIAKAYNIPLDREHIRKHNEIAATACPGSLDVDRIINRAKEILTPVPSTMFTKMVEVESDTFINIVTGSSEYDEIRKALGLPIEAKKRVGGHMEILEDINRRISEAMLTRDTTAPINPTVSVPAAAVPENTPTEQAVPFLQKEVVDILKDLAQFFKWKRGVKA